MPASLSLVESLPSKELESADIYPGVPVQVTQGLNVIGDIHGIAGAYQPDITGACLEDAGVDNQNILIWDGGLAVETLPDALRFLVSGKSVPPSQVKIRDNQFQLLSASLHGPTLNKLKGEYVLSLRPHFEFCFNTAAFAAQLGEIRLVESQRFLMLEDGSKKSLVDTFEQDILVSQNSAGKHREVDAVFTCLFAAQAWQTQIQYSAEGHVYQNIPHHYEGQAVASVTVLEKYTSYFLQRYCSEKGTNGFWVPVLAPLIWGWSIRVGKIGDGEWAIVKRKLLLPTVGHEGLQLPQWSKHIAHCELVGC